jgi:hypothetical protein
MGTSLVSLHGLTKPFHSTTLRSTITKLTTCDDCQAALLPTAVLMTFSVVFFALAVARFRYD